MCQGPSRMTSARRSTSDAAFMSLIRYQAPVGSMAALTKRKCEAAFVLDGYGIARADVLPETFITLQPPERRPWEREIFGTFLSEGLEVSDCLLAVGWIVAGVGSVVFLGEVPSILPVELQ